VIDSVWQLLLRYFRGRADFLEAMRVERAMRVRGLAHASRIPSWTGPAELRALHDLAAAAPPNATVLEIGSYLGASSCYLAAGLAAGGGRLICVDTWNNETMPDGERDTFAEFTRNTRAVADRITTVRKRSDDLRDGDVPRPIHLAFIDGDHGYDAVRRDFDIVTSWLAPGGVIAFHDFGDANFIGVTRVVGEALASGSWVQRGFVRTLAWITPAVPDASSAADAGHDTPPAEAERPIVR
jgi:predicted O-methyltransferase YrrM